MKKFYSISTILLFLAGGLTAKETANSNALFEGQDPIEVIPLANIQAIDTDDNLTIALSDVFSETGEIQIGLTFALVSNSHADVATISIENDEMTLDFIAAGQTIAIISATSGNITVNDTICIGVTPEMTGLYDVADFEDRMLGTDTCWFGADLSGEFESGPVHFVNEYNSEYASWNGFAYSNKSDVTTAGFTNQYSPITGTGFNEGTDIFAVSYAPYGSSLYLNDSVAHEIKGFYVTNATYAALSMLQGDAYSKVFGGADGNDEDWFKLSITGKNDGAEVGTVDYLLADFTAADKAKDYIIQTWQFVDLSSLGKVDALSFAMSSTDNGDWGMNTPGYFCIDNMLVVPNTSSAFNEKADANFVNVYPNPSEGVFTIDIENGRNSQINVFDLSARQIYTRTNFLSGNSIDLSAQAAGTYILVVKNGDTIERLKIVKK